MSDNSTVDRAKIEAFQQKVLADGVGASVAVMAGIGERLGLFRVLAANGPASSEKLAAPAGVNERYTREWLRQMACAGYLDYDRTAGRYSLPPERVPVLAQEGGPNFMGGFLEMVTGGLSVVDHVEKVFQIGGGVHQSAYSHHLYDGAQRYTGTWYENLLLPVWLPAMPDIQAKLDAGAELADVGCGRGRAIIKLAQAFPKSRFVGYDVFEPNIAQATANAEAAGVADRVRFVVQDVSKGLPAQYDVITTFDVIHDSVDPLGLLRTIRQGLKPDGRYLCLEVNCADDPDDNAGPLATVRYGMSLLYCMTTSLANGGEGLGALGVPEAKLRDLCAQAGFGQVRPVPLPSAPIKLYVAEL